VTDWLQRAAAFFPEGWGCAADETDETMLSSASSVDPPGLCEQRDDLSSVSSVGQPPVSAKIADPEQAALDWLYADLLRDVVPAADALERGINAGHARAILFRVAKEHLLEQRGVDGRLYWSRPYSPADINARFASWRAWKEG
jgi:hypothetical protein